MSRARIRFFDQEEELTNQKHIFAKMATSGNLNAMKDCWQDLNATQKNEYLDYLEYEHFARILQNDNFAEIMEWLKQAFTPGKFYEALYTNDVIFIFRNLMSNHHFDAARWLHQNCQHPEITRIMLICGEHNSLSAACYYGDDEMVDYIMGNLNPNDVDGLFHDLPYTQSSFTGKLAFVQRIYDLTVSHDKRFTIDENGEVTGYYRLMVLSMIEENFKISLHPSNAENDILAIWDWHAEKISVTNMQHVIREISLHGVGLFEKALSFGMNACAKWMYTHASHDHRMVLDRLLAQPNFAELRHEFQLAATEDVSKLGINFIY